MLCSCSSVTTSVEPYHSNGWVIESTGYYSTYEEAVLNDAKKQAAAKSNSEGMDCFVVSSGKTSPRSEERRTTTMYGKSSDGTSFSYEVPSTGYNYSSPNASLYVSFHKYDECKNFEITKGQDKVFYNDETIKNANYAGIKYLMWDALIWGVALFPLWIIPLILIIS
jgi:hypothetical protein